MSKVVEQNHWVLNHEAVEMADAEFAAVKGHPRKIGMSSAEGDDRKLWMDLYVKFGGVAHKVGNSEVRIAPMVMEDALTRETDRVFWDRHPELGGRLLTLAVEDGRYRKAWMDLYIDLGGRVVEVGHSGIRIPKVLLG